MLTEDCPQALRMPESEHNSVASMHALRTLGVSLEYVQEHQGYLVQEHQGYLVLVEPVSSQLMDAFDSKPKLFVRNFRALKPSDKVKCLGQYRDPRPCVAVDKELEPMPGHEYD